MPETPVPPPTPLPPKSRARKAWQIFRAYLTAMLFAFTGGAVTLPLQQQLLADKFKLTTRERVLENFALAQIIPGVISISSGVLMGLEIAGVAGATAAVLGITAPAMLGMLFITASYTLLAGIPVIAGVIAGIRAASIAIILTNALTITAGAKGRFAKALAVLALVSTLLGLNVLVAILACGALGVIRVFWQRRKEAG